MLELEVKVLQKLQKVKSYSLQMPYPGDVVDITTFKKSKSFYEGKVTHFHERSARRTQHLFASIMTLVVVANGKKWPMRVSSILNKKKL